jgi:hypothetical protein
MKIYSYNEETKQFTIAFASDETKSQNPDDYVKLAYNPFIMFPDITDPTLIPEKIALSGLYETKQQAKQEQLYQDPLYDSTYKNLEGQILTFDENDLTSGIINTGLATQIVNGQ